MWNLFHISLLYYTSVIAPLRLALAQQMFGKDIYHLGPYVFLACEDTQAQGLMRLFAETGNTLMDQVIPQVKSSTFANPIQDPFHVFFSSNTRFHVANVYQAMIDAPTVPVRPVFVCVNPDSASEIADARRVCTSHNAAAFSTLSTINLEGTVFLCPGFFEKPAFPTASNCPAVDYWFNRYFRNTGHAVDNQFSIITHELAHYYSPHPIFGLQEVYNLNNLVYKSADFQLNNPDNFAYFAACKSKSPLHDLAGI